MLEKNDTKVNFKDIDSVDALSCYDPEKMFHNTQHYRPCEMETKNIYDLKVNENISCIFMYWFNIITKYLLPNYTTVFLSETLS